MAPPAASSTPSMRHPTRRNASSMMKPPRNAMTGARATAIFRSVRSINAAPLQDLQGGHELIPHGSSGLGARSIAERKRHRQPQRDGEIEVELRADVLQ